MTMSWLLLGLCLSGLGSSYASQRPNIVMFLTDDLGYNAPGFHNPDVISPTLDQLHRDGLELMDHYVYRFCAPTRSSFLSGRMPFKLAATRENLNPAQIKDGLHLSYQTVGNKLQQAGYSTHQFGKWHQGFYKKEYTPLYRGFNSSYGFLTGGESHFSEKTITSQVCGGEVDIWDTDHPAHGVNGTWSAKLFADAAIRVIENHAASRDDQGEIAPLFLHFCLHNTHGPTEAPARLVKLYNKTGPGGSIQNTFNAMITGVDETVRNVTDALKAAGMYNNTLLVWTTDNGAEVVHNLTKGCEDIPMGVSDKSYCGGGSNYPLKGGKGSNWEGGVHVPTIVSGPFLPETQRGKQIRGLAHISDWYATFSSIAGVDPADPGGIAPLDSINLWPWLSGQESESPREFIVHDHRMYTAETTGAIRYKDWKLIVRRNECQASWFGKFTPNASDPTPTFPCQDCSRSNPCLYNIKDDPTEHHEVSQAHSDIVQQLLAKFDSLEHEYHPPAPSAPQDPEGFCRAVKANQGFLGPWE